MARVYKSKNVQTKPEKSGEANMTSVVLDKSKDVIDDGLMGVLIPMLDESIRQRVRGTNWTGEEMQKSIREYFIYCANNGVKPSKSSIRVWLGVSRSQYHAWQSEPAKYGVISDLVNLANDMMETHYINRIESYPTGNIFLLKTSHGHVDKQEVNITATTDVSQENILETVNKLGLTGEIESK